MRRPPHPARRPVLGLCLLALVAVAHWGVLQQAPQRAAPPPVWAQAPTGTLRVVTSRSTRPAAAPPPALAPRRTAPRRPVAATPPAAEPPTPPPTPHLQAWLPASTELHYQWRQRDHTAPARLVWQWRDAHYTLQLTTAPDTAPRATSWWHSHGAVGPDGLMPQRHTARRAPASERALTFIREGDQISVAFSSQTYARAAPPDVQDAISWLPHWLARLAAGQAEAPLTVAEVDGQVQPWRFMPDPADPWHWQTTAAPAQTAIELWLHPEAPHWPLRMVVTPAWGAPWVMWRAVPQPEAADASQRGEASFTP